jgi:hypothetical protein
MNHKQMLDKIQELEHRISVLEHQRQLEQQAKREAPMVAQASWHETTRLDPRYRSESLT